MLTRPQSSPEPTQPIANAHQEAAILLPDPRTRHPSSINPRSIMLYTQLGGLVSTLARRHQIVHCRMPVDMPAGYEHRKSREERSHGIIVQTPEHQTQMLPQPVAVNLKARFLFARTFEPLTSCHPCRPCRPCRPWGEQGPSPRAPRQSPPRWCRGARPRRWHPPGRCGQP